MKTAKYIRTLLLSAGLFAAFGASAATVYCPNGTTSLTAPTLDRYVKVTNAANPGECKFTEGNLDTSSSGQPVYESMGYEFLDKNGSPGTFLTGGYVNDARSGTWSLESAIWSSYDQLFLGFHFGGGGGTPDSFVVELEKGKTSGLWAFLAADDGTVKSGNDFSPSLNGLSNLYLFTKLCTGDCGNNQVPEPGSLALLGLGLLGLTALRRRRS